MAYEKQLLTLRSDAGHQFGVRFSNSRYHRFTKFSGDPVGVSVGVNGSPTLISVGTPVTVGPSSDRLSLMGNCKILVESADASNELP